MSSNGSLILWETIKYISKFMGCRFLFLTNIMPEPRFHGTQNLGSASEPGFCRTQQIFRVPLGSLSLIQVFDQVPEPRFWNPGSGTWVPSEPKKFFGFWDQVPGSIWNPGSGTWVPSEPKKFFGFYVEPRFWNLGSART